MNDGKRYAAKAYAKHTAKVHHVLRNKSLTSSYNEKIRPAFSSIIMAGKQKEAAEFVLDVGSDYVTQAREAWGDAAAAVDNEKATQLDKDVREVAQTRKNIKRKMKESAPVDLLVGSQESPLPSPQMENNPLYSPPDTPAAKRVKAEPVKVEPEPVEPEPVPPPAVVEDSENENASEDTDEEADEEAKQQAEMEAMVKNAAQQPLPDDGDDMEL